MWSTADQRFIACSECETFDLCSQCAESSPSCFDLDHSVFARRSFRGTNYGRCRRALKPIQQRYRVPCDSCHGMFDKGSFAFRMSPNPITVSLCSSMLILELDCCACKNDNFELCLDCVIRGQTCLDAKHHTLQYMTM